MNKVQKRFSDAIDTLYNKNHFLAAELTKLGYPKLITGYPPSAGVMWDKNKKKIVFMFNEEFLDKLNDEELAFVVAHEGWHLIGGHVIKLRDEAEKLERLNEPPKKIDKFVKKFNIAADCVVNDSLVNLFDFPRLENIAWLDMVVRKDIELAEFSKKCKVPVELFIKLNEHLSAPTDMLARGSKLKLPFVPIYGKEKVGMDCEDLTAMDVFYLLKEEPGQGSDSEEGEGDGEGGESSEESGGVGNHEGWRSFTDENGNLDKDFVDSMKKFIDKNIESSALSDEEKSTVSDLRETMKDSNDEYAAQAGHEAMGQSRSIGAGNESLRWNKVLSQLVETRKTEDVWNRPNRKLSAAYPDVILPTSKEQEKQEIFVAIDASGSIDYNALSLFATVLKNSPGNLEIKAISFDTMCYEYDVKGSEPPKGGGGTRFDIIEWYIQENFKKYPKAVFVLTDGGGNHVEPQHPNRWCWVLYGYASETYCGTMKRYKIEELLK